MAKKVKRRCKRRKNPELLILTNPVNAKVHNAIKAFQRFHWTSPSEIIEIELPEGINAKYLIKIGNVERIDYDTENYSERSKISKRWYHQFKDKPYLCTTPKGDVLIIFGGGLRVTPRGIEG